MQRVILANALLTDGWAQDVEVTINDAGEIVTVRPGFTEKNAVRVDGYSIPGMPNVHSHAFQRVFSGMAEHRSGQADNFWSWREQMYAIAGIVESDDLYDIARQLYMEMLQAGYTSVAEFHYLHQRTDGTPYDNPAETALVLLQAARECGIHLTLLPVLYMRGGFDKLQIENHQRRFFHTIEDFSRLIVLLAPQISHEADARLGIALHSLRAVTPDAISAAVDMIRNIDRSAPIHIHVAEQQKEVEDCLRHTGMRPVQWLLEHQPVDEHWCLVHATHMDEMEITALAATGAIAGLCPTTEANLGDGLFPLQAFLTEGGKIGIGSDSNVSVSPVEEMRWLEYGQRLVRQQRNIVADSTGSCGAGLISRCVTGGAQACGLKSGVIAPGYRADILCLDADSPGLFAKPEKYLLDSYIFSGNDQSVRHVIAGGRWQVRDFRHVNHEAVTVGYRTMLKRLYARLARI